MEDYTPYKEILANEIIAGDQSLVFKFQFTRHSGGIVIIEDVRNIGTKNATFGLNFKSDNSLFLRIVAKDFEFLVDNPVRSVMEINQEFYSAIALLTNGLHAFHDQ